MNNQAPGKLAADSFEFCSEKCRRDFRRALAGVPSKSFIERAGDLLIINVRPLNLLVFGASINRHGLENCDAAKSRLRWLDRNPGECIRFEHRPTG